jgi:hypothetical protein
MPQLSQSERPVLKRDQASPTRNALVEITSETTVENLLAVPQVRLDLSKGLEPNQSQTSNAPNQHV